MPLTPSTRLGPYEILAPLGAGGMGEVYRAHDPRLKRDVAIKVLPDDVASTPGRLVKRRSQILSAAGAMCVAAVALAGTPPPSSITIERPATHVMRYHLALPVGWTREKTWPVVVVIPDASREFAANLQAFVAARGTRPFLLVAPEVMSCGGARSRTPNHYSLTPAEWDSIRAGDDFAFDDAGLVAVLADVRERWNGESKAFLTGWEAGGHTVWAQTFRRPERWRAVAPVTTNYLGRGLDAGAFSNAPERASLAIQVFRCGAPSGSMAEGLRQLDPQIAKALADGRAHGFTPSPVRTVPGADHGPLAGPVLAWFETLLRR